jgi:hypothetical protein
LDFSIPGGPAEFEADARNRSTHSSPFA